jgi:hypothetical protein
MCIHANPHSHTHMHKPPDECQLQQCALQPLECIQSNWSEPALGTPSMCASLKWRPRYYEEDETPAITGSDLANFSVNMSTTSSRPGNSTNGTNSSTSVVKKKKDRAGFLVRDPPCHREAQWLVCIFLFPACAARHFVYRRARIGIWLQVRVHDNVHLALSPSQTPPLLSLSLSLSLPLSVCLS